MASEPKAPEQAAPLNVWQRISAVMRDLPYIQKKKAVNLGGRDVKTLAYEDLAAQVQPLLVQHGLVLLSDLVDLNVETLESEKPGYNGAPPKKVVTTIATVKMRFTLACTDNQEIREGVPYISGTPWLTFPGMGYDTSDKAVGKATTYAAKDFLRKMFVVPSGEEPEDDDHERPARGKPPTPSQDGPEAFPPTDGPIGAQPRPEPSKEAVDELEKLTTKQLCNKLARGFVNEDGKYDLQGGINHLNDFLSTMHGSDFSLGADMNFGLTDAVPTMRRWLVDEILRQTPPVK